MRFDSVRDCQAPPLSSLRASSQPLIAVVIPVYRQPQYLADAVLSAVRQSLRGRVRVVIVNDGCPYPSTERLGRQFADTLPGEVFYLRKDNGGLSSARNYGIRFALAAWPSVQAVFPLDADNRLSPTTLERLWQRLEPCGPEVGWVYQDLDFFGTDHTYHRCDVEFSLYRLLLDNYCDAGSLIRRRVFVEGIWYDEEMRSGYEDWELFIHAALRGFRGVYAPDTGFHYRKHGHSLLSDSKQKHEAIVRYVSNKHPQAYRHDSIVNLEHQAMPRFALVEPGCERVDYFTVPGVGASQTVLSDELAEALACWSHGATPGGAYVPPVLLVAAKAHLDLLGRFRILPMILHSLSTALQGADCASMTLEIGSRPNELSIEEQVNRRAASGAAQATSPTLMAVSARVLARLASGRPVHTLAVTNEGTRLRERYLHCRIGRAFLAVGEVDFMSELTSLRRGEALSVINRICQRVAAARVGMVNTPASGGRKVVSWPSPTDYALRRSLDTGAAPLPYAAIVGDGSANPVNVHFVVPWIGLGGVDQCVLSLARALRARNPSCAVHLVVTAASGVEASASALAPFSTVSWLPLADSKGPDALLALLSSADVVIIAHSRECYELLPKLRASGKTKVLSYLHVIEIDPRGVPGGYVFMAAQEYEAWIDRFLVISNELRHWCLNLGVPEEKLLIAPNAPTVAPPDVDTALAITRGKTQRSYSRASPLRLLYVGRFDRQKGIDRLAEITKQLDQTGIPYRLRMVGKAVILADAAQVQVRGAEILPPVLEKESLAQHYVEADVLLLPSRYEGVPLVALEAMAYGAVVIATRVGAIDEAIEHGRNGFLLAGSGSEPDIINEACRLIGDIASNPQQYYAIREQACRDAMAMSWHKAAAAVGEVIDEVLSGRCTEQKYSVLAGQKGRM